MVYEDKKTVMVQGFLGVNGAGCGIQPPTRPSVSSQYYDQMSMLRERADMLAEKLHMRLLPISQPPCETQKNDDCAETWPDYFTDLRKKAWGIDRALDCIEDALNRLEI